MNVNSSSTSSFIEEARKALDTVDSSYGKFPEKLEKKITFAENKSNLHIGNKKFHIYQARGFFTSITYLFLAIFSCEWKEHTLTLSDGATELFLAKKDYVTFLNDTDRIKKTFQTVDRFKKECITRLEKLERAEGTDQARLQLQLELDIEALNSAWGNILPKFTDFKAAVIELNAPAQPVT